MDGRHMLLILTLVGTSVLGGCNFYLSGDAKKQLAAANAAYAAGDNATVIRQTDAFLSHNSRSKRADEAYYLRGVARYNLAKSQGDRGLYQSAKTDLEQAVAKSDNPDLRAKAGLTLGHLSFDTGDFDLAERMYRFALDNVGKDPVMGSEGHYRLGCTLQQVGKWRDADLHFQKVMYNYPNTEAARSAARRVNANAWTVQAGSFQKQGDADRAAAALHKKYAAAFKNEPPLPARAVAVLDGQPRYVVQVGRFAGYDGAKAMFDRVQKVSEAFVTVTR